MNRREALKTVISKINHDDVYALDDIREDMGDSWSERILERNIKYLLEREGLLPKGWRVSMANLIAMKEAELRDVIERYRAHFEVLAPPPAGYATHVLAYTGIAAAEAIRGELLSLELSALTPRRSVLK